MIHLFNKIWLKQSVKTLLKMDSNFSGGGQNNRVKRLNIKSDRSVKFAWATSDDRVLFLASLVDNLSKQKVKLFICPLKL